MKGRIAIIGSGSWATALVKILAHPPGKLHWWVRSEETADHIRLHHRNPNYLSYLDLPTERLHVSTNLKQIIRDADYLIFAIPAAFLNTTLHGITPKDFKGKTVISAIKGIVPEYHSTVTDFFQKQFSIPVSNLGIISGPCHSEEVAMEKLSFLTLAIEDQEKAAFLQTHFKAPFIRLSLSRDLTGVEYAAILKNIMAIANGIAVGLGYGDNFQSVLIVNAIQEARRFLDKLNGAERDFNDSAYLGDLIVTCYSQFSRNRTFGNMIGKGYSPKFARIEMKMVAEGYYAVKGIKEINKEYGVYMPVIDAVYNILYEGISPYMEMKILADKLK
jgi:glycerol-3-phosphate dehydrogenase (NAD(P)+)